MLVLSRKENESIEFPALGVVIRVFGLRGKRVQLGIDAPISLQVTRGEKAGAGSARKPVDSIAEHVIGEEFTRLKSAVSEMADLARGGDQSLADQLVAESLARISRIQRIVKSSIHRQTAEIVDEDSEADVNVHTRDADAPWSQAGDATRCVNQTASGYRVIDTSKPQAGSGEVCVA